VALAVIALGVVLVIWAAFTYNRLVALRNRAQGAWSDIDVQLKRRHDLVASLVETVKGYAKHERETLEAVVDARQQAAGARQAGDPAAAGQAESRLADRVRQLFALAESYPDLKASRSFADLHRSLVEIENALQNARRYYNAVVRDLNTRIESLPDNIVAGAAGFEPMAFFELADPSEAAVPEVDLEVER
jgi:LemA protein